MEGKAGYVPTPGYEHKLHFIGDVKSPIWWGEKGDVPKLFTSEFWAAYEVWRKMHLGMGLPNGTPWTAQDQWLMDTVAAFEEHYRGNFSPERYLAEVMIAGFRAMAQRR